MTGIARWTAAALFLLTPAPGLAQVRTLNGGAGAYNPFPPSFYGFNAGYYGPYYPGSYQYGNVNPAVYNNYSYPRSANYDRGPSLSYGTQYLPPASGFAPQARALADKSFYLAPSALPVSPARELAAVQLLRIARSESGALEQKHLIIILKDVIKTYPETESAKEAKAWLEKLSK